MPGVYLGVIPGSPRRAWEQARRGGIRERVHQGARRGGRGGIRERVAAAARGSGVPLVNSIDDAGEHEVPAQGKEASIGPSAPSVARRTGLGRTPSALLPRREEVHGQTGTRPGSSADTLVAVPSLKTSRC